MPHQPDAKDVEKRRRARAARETSSTNVTTPPVLEEGVTLKEFPLNRPQEEVHLDQHRFRVVVAGRRTGKLLALDTPIPTLGGWERMEDIVVGSQVFDETGHSCTVIAVTDPVHDHRCFRITFNDGVEVVAGAEHEWLTWDRKQRKN